MSESTEKPIWIIVALIGLLLSPVIFIVGMVFGIEINDNINFSSDTLSSWVAAFATVAIAVLTFVLAKETWYLRLAQIRQINELRKESIRPAIEFYLLSSPVSFQFMNVHIENNGKGIARNITFSFYGENGKKLSENEKEVVDNLLKLNILNKGMLALGSGKQRSSFIFSFIELSEKLGSAAFEIRIEVKIKFQDIEGLPYETMSILDFSEFKGISELGGGDPIYNLYKETEKVRKVLEGFTGSISSKRLNINLHTSEDRVNEQERVQKRIDENRNKGS